MAEILTLTWKEFERRCEEFGDALRRNFGDWVPAAHDVYPVSRSGAFVAMALARRYGCEILDIPRPKCLLVDGFAHGDGKPLRAARDACATLRAFYFASALFRTADLAALAFSPFPAERVRFPWDRLADAAPAGQTKLELGA